MPIRPWCSNPKSPCSPLEIFLSFLQMDKVGQSCKLQNSQPQQNRPHWPQESPHQRDKPLKSSGTSTRGAFSPTVLGFQDFFSACTKMVISLEGDTNFYATISLVKGACFLAGTTNNQFLELIIFTTMRPTSFGPSTYANAYWWLSKTIFTLRHLLKIGLLLPLILSFPMSLQKLLTDLGYSLSSTGITLRSDLLSYFPPSTFYCKRFFWLIIN